MENAVYGVEILILTVIFMVPLRNIWMGEDKSSSHQIPSLASGLELTFNH